MDQFEDRTARLLILLAIESALNDPKGVSAKELAQSILNPGGRAWKAGGESRRVRSKGGGKEFDEDKLRLARAKLQALSEEERDAMIKTHVMAVKDGGYLVKPAEREGSDED